MSGATDPINFMNPSFYSFNPFWAQNQKIQKCIKIPIIFLIFPFSGNRQGSPKAPPGSLGKVPALELPSHREAAQPAKNTSKTTKPTKPPNQPIHQPTNQPSQSLWGPFPIPLKGKNQEYLWGFDKFFFIFRSLT